MKQTKQFLIAIRIARSMPKWKPSETRGTPTRMRSISPVTFRLKE